MDNFVGKKLDGRYEILELIGFGGMAVVYKAHDILENRFVAVKILKNEYLESDDFKRRFRNESKAIALLSHPNVVKILDVNFSDNIQYIAMEYIDGITLKEYIEQQGVVKWKEAVHFTVQILRALQHAHDNGIVHRDVKPQNVMLLQDGTIKVMDFGIARFARESGKTMTDKAIGSVHYISPEQAKGDSTDEKTDIYAVGVILYEMLTGRVPFDGDTPISIALKQMQIEPPVPSSVNPDIPTGIEEIILRAMQKDPILRYQTAAEMLRDIDEFKRNPSVVFEYKYMDVDGSTRYFNKVDASNEGGSGATYATAPKKRSYVMNILAGVTAACVLLAVVALYMFFKGINSKTDEITLPSFIGMTVADAQAKQSAIKIKVVDEQPSPEYEKGIIIDQKPADGIKVKKNFEVEVTVSTGVTAVMMPDLKNEMASAAKSKLNALGITDIKIANMTDNNVPVGRVISTDPEPDTEITKGDTVFLYVSIGAADEPVRMPALIGSTEIEARMILSKLDITATVAYEASTEEKGKIFWQSIEPDEKVKRGSNVEIKISNGETEGTTAGTNISIVFPAGADNRDFVFEVYIDGTLVETLTVNPAVSPGFNYELSLVDGMINGKVSATEGANTVTILADNNSFAQYSVDFSKKALSEIFKPRFELLFESGVVPTQGDEVTNEQSSSSED